MVLVNLAAVMSQNSNLWDKFVVPVGMDRDEIIDNIIMETMELSLAYSEPKILEYMIGTWSRRKLYNWNELYKTLSYKYNPIDNYDRWEEWVDRVDSEGSNQNTANFDNNGNKGGNDTRTPNLQEVTDQTTTETNNSNTDTDSSASEQVDGTTHSDTKHKVWGFNNAASVDSYEDITDADNHQTTTTNGNSHTEVDGTTNSTGKETRKNTGTEKNEWTENYNDNGTSGYQNADQNVTFNAHKAHMRGNIGVTTTQQMIEQQRKIVTYNIIDTIVEDFKRQFCILVY